MNEPEDVEGLEESDREGELKQEQRVRSRKVKRAAIHAFVLSDCARVIRTA
jgi:hypothetical protein